MEGNSDTLQDKQQVVRLCSNSDLICQVFTAYLTVWLGWALPQLVSRGEEEESEIERIQELFPHDDLRLYDRDPVTQKMKGLMRKRSTTAARLQRAFSAKGLRGPDHQHNNNKDATNNNNTNNAANTSGLPPNRTREGRPKRQFIMETPATFTTGVQSQERHLFLFSDLLLVAKARSGGNFKLKEKVRVSELWLSSCLDDVAEVAKSHDTSFVMGWPTTNVVASFSCVATKDLWYNKLCQVMTEERDKEPPTTTVQVTYFDPINNIDFSKTVNIGSTTTARECVSLTLDHLEMGGADATQFQLWVKTGVDDSPYPLIGHEFPFAIKMNCVRDLLQDCDAEQCNNLYNAELVTRCQFILRQARKLNFESPEGVKKVSKKARKSPIRIHRVFKRANSKGDSLDGSVNSCPAGVLYGHSLVKLVEPENFLPKPVMDMMSQLFLKGPFTVGIFRKSANARLVRELREKLDSGDVEGAVDLDSVQITVVAALLKDFLRSMPDCLLVSDLYEEWLELTHILGFRERISQTLLLCSRLPRAHLKLLQHFLCVLHHIVRRASENMMSASNLAVCVGPSILWPSSPVLALSPEASKQVPAVVEFLIERCGDVFGQDVLHLLGEPPQRDPMRQDSGAEESDSLHSLHSGHSLHSSGGMRRDDSSIDSLEGELSPLPRKDKMSLTNLSRDSGLTMSDSQLYTPDEEESESTSSGHSGADKSVSNYSSGGQSERSGDRFQHYSAPNNPNAIYATVYRRSEKVPIGYDDPDSYYAAPSRDHARIQVTYSTPGYPQGPHGQGKEYTRVYQSRHDRLGDVYRKCPEEEAIYSIPVGASGNLINPPTFVVNSNFQRHDWMRRRSNLRKVSRSSSGDGSLVRSTSEESLLNKYNGLDYGVSLGPAGVMNKRPAQHGKGRAPPPPPEDEQDDCTGLGGRESPIRRSKSAHYLTEPSHDDRIGRSPDNTPAVSRSSSHDAVSWHRSRSTPQIHDEADRSYDSSTLSDDDSTPHVSRSNSRGKECGGGGSTAWDAVYGTEHTPSDSSESHTSCNSSFKSERTGSMCTVVSAGSTSTLGSNPPSYEEALNRRSLIYRGGTQQVHPTQGSPSGKDGHVAEYIREEKMKSAKAKQLYEESLRIYQEENTYPNDLVRASPAHADVGDDYERPPPLPPKSEPPPLPPKQRGGGNGSGSRRLSDGLSRLKHLPPVHVETHARKARSVSSLPTSYGCDPPYHKTIIYTDDSPPSLPPKERTVIEIESAYLQLPESRVRQMTSRAVSPPIVEKKSIETQTDEYDLDDEVKDEGIQTSGSWVVESHVTSVSVPDQSSMSNCEKHRSRARRRDSSTSHRSKSVPTRETVQAPDSDDDDDDDWEYTSPSLQDFPGGPAALRDLRQLDPDLRQEISWSVSQLRAIFGETLKGAKVHPPPYRPPPSSHRAPITSYHLGAGDAFITRKSRPHSSYGEESYV